MAVLKCKMCGGDLEVTEGVSVCECAYCGTKQTVPSADNEKKVALFGRANRLRFANEFDKAAGVYESIVADFPEEAEAYWGLVLCKYGIEYVDDPATGKKIPTCHRSSFDSVMDDGNYEQALENADAPARSIYREEAKRIEELRKGIIEVSSKEEPYDIFICYKETAENGERTLDSVIAQDVYNALTEKGYRVFFSRISLEDKLGVEYEPYIFAALNSAKVMLAFGTDYEYYNAVWVKNEWSRFLQLIAKGEKKTLIPCYKGIDAYDMPKEFAKLQAQDMGKVGAIQDLLRGIGKILPKNKETAAAGAQQPVAAAAPAAPGVASLLERAFIFLEDGAWADADTYCDKVLDIDPKCAQAYLGKLMAELHARRQENLADCEQPFDDSNNYQKVLRFGNDSMTSAVKGYLATAQERYNEKLYNDFCSQMNAVTTEEQYVALAGRFEKLTGFRDADARAKACHEKAEQIKTEKREAEEKIKAEKQRLLEQRREAVKCCQGLIAQGYDDTIVLRPDGTVITQGRNYRGQQKKARTWTDIVAVSAASEHMVGLRSDGTVVACGENEHGQCDVQSWRDIVAIAAGGMHTVGLKADGTVVATKYKKGDGFSSYRGQCDVEQWRNIVAIAAGYAVTYGLRADGTVVSTKEAGHYEAAVRQWRNVISISAGFHHVAGLCADGSVVEAGSSEYGENGCRHAGRWDNIVEIFAFYGKKTYGLCADGTVVLFFEGKDGYDNDGYEEERFKGAVWLVESFHTVSAVMPDGSIVNQYGERQLPDVKVFENLDDVIRRKKEQRIAAEQRRANLPQQAKLQAERMQKDLCPYCGGEFKKGLFSTKCLGCGRTKDY